MSEGDGCCSQCARHAGATCAPASSAKAAGADASSAVRCAVIGHHHGLLEGTPVDPSLSCHPQPDSAITVAVTDSAPSEPTPRCSARRFAARLSANG